MPHLSRVLFSRSFLTESGWKLSALFPNTLLHYRHAWSLEYFLSGFCSLSPRPLHILFPWSKIYYFPYCFLLLLHNVVSVLASLILLMHSSHLLPSVSYAHIYPCSFSVIIIIGLLIAFHTRYKFQFINWTGQESLKGTIWEAKDLVGTVRE